MREILFRGKRKDNGEWVEGFYYVRQAMHGKLLLGEPEHVITTGVLKIYGAYGEREQLSQVEVIPETVGQFTGLTDIGGKKIFEGDIMKTAVTGLASHTGVVEFADGAFGLRCTDGAGLFLCYVAGSFTIIGNVHDHPELLEVK